MGWLLPALGSSPAGVRGAGGRALLDGIPGGISVKPTCQAGLRLKSGFVLHVHEVCSTGLLPMASGDHLCFRRLTGSSARAQCPRTGGMAVCSRGSRACPGALSQALSLEISILGLWGRCFQGQGDCGPFFWLELPSDLHVMKKAPVGSCPFLRGIHPNFVRSQGGSKPHFCPARITHVIQEDFFKGRRKQTSASLDSLPQQGPGEPTLTARSDYGHFVSLRHLDPASSVCTWHLRQY